MDKFSFYQVWVQFSGAELEFSFIFYSPYEKELCLDSLDEFMINRINSECFFMCMQFYAEDQTGTQGLKDILIDKMYSKKFYSQLIIKRIDNLGHLTKKDFLKNTLAEIKKKDDLDETKLIEIMESISKIQL